MKRIRLQGIRGLLVFITLIWSMGASAGNWLILDIENIGVASQQILDKTLAKAQESGAAGIVVRLDSPGGTLDATRHMVKAILNASVPVVVWVGPGGARAGSAGAFITLAGHVAAMAPGTNIGAAHPVGADGKDIGPDMRNKVQNDTEAFMESIAKVRQRNLSMARSFVVNSVSITAEEALEHQVIDLIAADIPELLRKINGRSITLGEGQQPATLQSDPAVTEVVEPSWALKLLAIISHPNVFYLLFVGGLLGLGFELTHPGGLVPGVLGGLSLILALIATSVLPVNFGSLLLIVVSVAFMVAELFVPSFGILGIGGIAGFVTGSLLLIDAEKSLGMGISLWLILPAVLFFVAIGLFIGLVLLKDRKRQPVSGVHAMVGQKGTVVERSGDQEYMVLVEGEYWRARMAGGEPLPLGSPVIVKQVQGLELVVDQTS